MLSHGASGERNAWSKLFYESDLIWSFEYRNYVSEGLLHWMLGHSYSLPENVCRMFDEHFEWHEAILSRFAYYEEKYTRNPLSNYFNKLGAVLPRTQALYRPAPAADEQTQSSSLSLWIGLAILSSIITAILSSNNRSSSLIGNRTQDILGSLSTPYAIEQGYESTEPDPGALASLTGIPSGGFDAKAGLSLKDTAFRNIRETGFASLDDAKKRLPGLVLAKDWIALREYVLIDSVMDELYLLCNDEESMLARLDYKISQLFYNAMPPWSLKQVTEDENGAILQYGITIVRLIKKTGRYFIYLHYTKQSDGAPILYQDLGGDALDQKLGLAHHVAVPVFMNKSANGVDLYVIIKRDEDINLMEGLTEKGSLSLQIYQPPGEKDVGWMARAYGGRALVHFHSKEPFERLLEITGITVEGDAIRYRIVR